MAGNLDIEVIRLRKQLHKERLLSFLLVLTLCVILWLSHKKDTVYEVRANGRPVAWLGGPHQAVQALSSAKNVWRRRFGQDTRFQQEMGEGITIIPVKQSGRSVMNEKEATQAIQRALIPQISAAQIAIDKVPVVTVRSRETAQTVLNAVKTLLLGDSENVVSTPHWKESVEIVDTHARPDQIEYSAQSAIGKILGSGKGKSTGQLVQYKVKAGDRAWSIAQAHGISVDDIRRLNPRVNLSKLVEGQSITIGHRTAGNPLLTLVSLRRRTYVETVPAPHREVASRDLPKGSRRVQQVGRPGKRKVTSEVLEENGAPISRKETVVVLLQEPQPAIVIVGQGAKADVGQPRSHDRNTTSGSKRPGIRSNRLPPPAPPG